MSRQLCGHNISAFLNLIADHDIVDNEQLESVEELVLHNARLAVAAAGRLHNGTSDFDDVLQNALTGLVEAARRFDPNKARLSTYATLWIRREVREGERLRYPLSLGRAGHDLLSQVRSAAGGAVDPEGPAVDGVDSHDVWLLWRALGAGGELHANVADQTLTDARLVDDDTLDTISTLEQFIGELSEREQEVLRLRYGLNGEPAMTLAEIGGRWGVTRQTVSLVEQRALRRLRAMLVVDDTAPEG